MEKNSWWSLFQSLMWQKWCRHLWDLLGSGALCGGSCVSLVLEQVVMQSHPGCRSPRSCSPSAVLAALQGLSTDLIKKKEIPCSVAWCCVVPSWVMVEWLMQVFISGRGKRGKVFWASIRSCFSDKCSSKQMWVLSLLVPLEPPIRASYMVPLGRESCISGVTPYCWGNGEGNSCV